VHVDITQLLGYLIVACGPVILGFIARNAFMAIRPTLARYMDERTLSSFQSRFDIIAHQGISYAVSQAATRVQAGQPITVDAKNWIAGEAVQYVVDHAPDTATQAGDVLGKVLARFDLHPAVQALVSPTPPVEPVTAGS